MVADENLTSRFRVVVFDLPWHGKSLPPAGWWKDEYLLTTDAYASLVKDFCAALELETPIVVGCSMAGSLAIELAHRRPDRWRAVVGQLHPPNTQREKAIFQQGNVQLCRAVDRSIATLAPIADSVRPSRCPVMSRGKLRPAAFSGLCFVRDAIRRFSSGEWGSENTFP
jgi:pimeloyl-ACP methyl ester carboxylesterase